MAVACCPLLWLLLLFEVVCCLSSLFVVVVCCRCSLFLVVGGEGGVVRCCRLVGWLCVGVNRSVLLSIVAVCCLLLSVALVACWC